MTDIPLYGQTVLASTTVSASPAPTSTVFTVASTADFAPGDICYVNSADQQPIQAIAGNQITLSTALSFTPSAGQSVENYSQPVTNEGLNLIVNAVNSLVNGSSLSLVVPTVDGTSAGPYNNDFVSGYTSSAVGDLVTLDSSGKWQKTDADTASLYQGMLAVAMEVKATDALLKVALPGSFVYATAVFPTMTKGNQLWMSQTAGAITETAPTATDSARRVLGYAVHADKIYFNPSDEYVVNV